ncbi:MAG: hypothetical protein FD161_1226 [Limisphaerales bacterium]|nr:MAG: hypothetical protein FD161_1226 [Limisphaerales bacterium]TXT49496.1 MAG: hypothetical protein FD140_3028 [Limisphaerales bacterium]
MNEPGPSLRASSLDGVSVQKVDSVYVSLTPGQTPGPVQQVVSPSVSTPKLVLNFAPMANGYAVNFYKGSALGAFNSTAGKYDVSGPAFKSVEVVNISNPLTKFDQLRVKVNEGGAVLVTEWQWVSDTTTGEAGWQRTRKSGTDPGAIVFDKLAVLKKPQTTVVDTTSYQERVERHLMTDVNGVVFSERTLTYRFFPWGEELLKEVRSPASAVAPASTLTNSFIQTTLFEYHSDDMEPDNYGLLKQVTLPSGRWEQFPSYNSQGLLTKRIAQFQNNAASTPEAENRVTTYTYDPQLGVRLILSETKIGTTTLNRSYYRNQVVGNVRTVTESVCTEPGALESASANLVTISKLHFGGDHDGEPISVQHPNGTVDAYDYSTQGNGNKIVEQNSGAANPLFPSGWQFTGGTVTRTVTDSQGKVVEVKVTDIETSEALSQENYNWPAEYTEVVTYLNGRSATRQYGCCGLESETDINGAATHYAYDALKRLTITTRIIDGVSTMNHYDAAGRISKITRHGSGGSIILLEQASYNSADEVTEKYFQRDDATPGLNHRYSFKRELYPNAGLMVTRSQPITGSGIVSTVPRTEIFNQDGTLWKVEGGAAHPLEYEYGVDADGYFVKEIKLGEGDPPAATEWTKRYYDLAGRVKKVVFPGATANTTVAHQYLYNAKGLEKEVDPDLVRTLYAYNSLGEVEMVALDTNRNDAIELNGKDRVVKTLRDVQVKTVGQQAYDVVRTKTIGYKTADNATETVLKTVETTTDGLRSWTTVDGKEVGKTETAYSVAGGITVRTDKVFNADLSYREARYENGRLMKATSYDKDGAIIEEASYVYTGDAHGRVKSIVETGVDGNDSRTYTFTYYDTDQIQTVAAPPAAAGEAAQVTTYTYDPFGRTVTVQHPDATTTSTDYYQTGEIHGTSGARTYWVTYTYDPQGRMRTMATRRKSVGNGAVATEAVTTWNYDAARGFLTEKRYPAVGEFQGSIQYPEYTAAGRLKKRQNASGITTTYTYDQIGQIDTIVSTGLGGSTLPAPTADLDFDRLGRLVKIVQGDMTINREYNDGAQMTKESYSGGPLNGFSVAKSFDSLSRLDDVAAKRTVNGVTSTDVSVDYNYDSSSRLRRVTLNNARADYAYVPNRPQVDTVTFYADNTGHARTKRVYDKLSRLTAVEHSVLPSYPHPAAPTQLGAPARLANFSYHYNTANQRRQMDVKPQVAPPINESWSGPSPVSRTNAWKYDYDTLGQLTSAKRYFTIGTTPELVGGQQFEFEFDDIGNRRWNKFGGDAAGGDLKIVNYGFGGESQANDLNQPEARTYPRFVNITGEAVAENTAIAINGSRDGIIWQGNYFRKLLEFPRADNRPQYVPITVKYDGLMPQGSGLAANSFAGFKLIPASYTDISPTHDAEGNVMYDDRWYYQWDSEGRLISMTTRMDLVPPSQQVVANLPDLTIQFSYDFFGRRIVKKVYHKVAGVTTLVKERRYVYDGWNLLAEYDGANNLQRSYAWGLDLSGTLQGAGGVGGLLLVYQHASTGTGSTVHNKPYFVHHDGNGNVMALLDGVAGTVAAWYEYGPFGEPIRMNGPMAGLNPFRFSTKYTDDETGLVYYGYRYYDTDKGRWLSRDPIHEWGGPNLYGFSDNNPVNFVDTDGRESMGVYYDPNGRWMAPHGMPKPSALNPMMPFSAGRSMTSWLFRRPLSKIKNEWDDTEWFDRNRPNSIAAAKKYFNDKVQAQKDRLCPGGDLAKIDDFFVGPQWVGPAGQSEAELGDPQQGMWESMLWLGWYQFRLDNFYFLKPTVEGRMQYEARIALVDKQGAEIKYTHTPASQFAAELLVGPSREVIYGRWTIRGTIDCCQPRNKFEPFIIP